MSRFIQIHALTAYPPSNPNRDDTGRPKTARVGGVDRLRLSSQSLKRAIRTSEEFAAGVEGRLGQRTQRIGTIVLEQLKAEGLPEDKAREAAKQVTALFGKPDSTGVETEQLVFITPDEREAAIKLGRDIVSGNLKGGSVPEIMVSASHAADVAMFGRMVASKPWKNFDAAVSLAHAFSVHAAPVEDDYYSAVDDLRGPSEDRGSSFIGEAGFGSAVHYLYASVNADLLLKNLGAEAEGSKELASACISAFVRALATVSPNGKRASFAHNPRASFLLVEAGQQQPRTLASAFMKPVTGDNILKASASALASACAAMDVAYGKCADERVLMHVGDDAAPVPVEGFKPRVVKSLDEVCAFASGR